jgi:hypothetical protein
MNGMWIIVFAGIAAVGNALFALGQTRSGIHNGLLFVAASALIACVLALVASPLLGRMMDTTVVFRGHGKSLLLSGAGLFLTYVGFNLLYTRFGTSPYVVYASMSILTTTVGVGYLYLRESMNQYHIGAILFAVIAIVMFSIGQSKA